MTDIGSTRTPECVEDISARAHQAPRRIMRRFFAAHSAAACAAARALVGVALGAMILPGAASGQSAVIFLDGRFDDWHGTVEFVDSAGDAGASGIDIREIDLANDDDNLFIRFVVTTDLGLQEPNNLELYLDTDDNPSTGLFVGGVGAELEWRFGDRQGVVYNAGGAGTRVFQDDVRLRQLPSVSSPVFEVSIGRDVAPAGITLFPASTIRVLLLDSGSGGDRAPNSGLTLAYGFDSKSIGPPTPIGLERDNANDTRFVTWNTRDLSTSGSFNAVASAAAGRVFTALVPEVICLQELRDVTSSQAAALIEGFLPSGAGEAWYHAKEDDNIVVSRFEILETWAVDRNLAVLLDADAKLGADVLLINAHFPCCDNNASRQTECDAVMAFFRDAKMPGGNVTVPSGTVLMLTGDLNLVGFSEQLNTLITGDIVNNANHGSDFTPDWDGTDLTDVVSQQTEMRYAYTWRNDFSSFAPGRLDFFIFSDSSVDLAKSFIIYTPEMSADELTRYGLLSGDVTTVSDHLPHIADFRINSTDVGPGGPGDDTGDGDGSGPGADRDDDGRDVAVRLTSLGAPGGDRVQFIVELDVVARLAIDIYDVRGAHVRTVRRPGDGVHATGPQRFEWDGRTGDGRRAANGTYLVRVTASAAVGNPGGTSRPLGVTSGKLLLIRP